MRLVIDSFSHLLYHRLYATAVYVIGSLVLGLGVAGLMTVGVDETSALWWAVGFAVPIHFALYAAMLAFKSAVRTVTAKVMDPLLDMTADVITAEAQQRLSTFAVYTAAGLVIASVTLLLFGISSLASLLFVATANMSIEFYVTVFLLELMGMVCVLLTPVAVGGILSLRSLAHTNLQRRRSVCADTIAQLRVRAVAVGYSALLEAAPRHHKTLAPAGDVMAGVARASVETRHLQVLQK